MAHCPPQLLDDLTDVIEEVRTWPGVIERKPGVFYLHGRPFLHFHLLEGVRRRADMKGRTGWAQLHLLRPLSTARRGTFLRALRMRHGESRPSTTG